MQKLKRSDTNALLYKTKTDRDSENTLVVPRGEEWDERIVAKLGWTGTQCCV